jgi:hypothetical protein
VHDVSLVCGRQGVGERNGEVEHAHERQSTRRDDMREALALDHFHGEEPKAVFVLDRVEHDHVRMIERRDRSRFAFESRQVRGLARERLQAAP